MSEALVTGLLEIIKISIPAIVVAVTVYLLIKKHFEKERHVRLMELKMNNRKDTLPIRLQAYERLTLFLERITPASQLTRVHGAGQTARQLQMALVTNIRMEYEHNMAQQIYLSADAWQTITISKDEVIKVINLIAETMPQNASSLDFSKALLDHYIKNEKSSPTQLAILKLRQEVKDLYV